MTTTLLSKRMFCVMFLLFDASWDAVSAQAADSPPVTRAPGFATTIEPRIAAGAVEDTLKACMARISKDASIGQRMTAEQSCGRDERDRNPFLAIPGAQSIRHEQPCAGPIGDRHLRSFGDLGTLRFCHALYIYISTWVSVRMDQTRDWTSRQGYSIAVRVGEEA